MRRRRRTIVMCGGLVVLLASGRPAAQQSPFNAHDDHTEYNLLDPSSHQFHIVYYLNQRQAGATTLLNQTRSGSEGSDVSVRDPQTGQPLKFEYKTGAELAAAGESGRLAPAEHYIRAFLPRPVPEGGEGRVRIEKTYLDEKSYYVQGEDIVFARSLGIGRNAIVLPRGYVLASSNVAGQVVALPDGRVKVAFENINTYAADVTIRGRKSPAAVAPTLPVVERAFDFAKTLYDFGAPDTHQVTVRHEYVEVRRGDRASLEFLSRHRIARPVVTDMDSGKVLEVSGAGVPSVKLEAPIANESQSAHLRISGVETDPEYRLDGAQLAWSRTLYEPRTTILLPAGWEITALSTPATVSTTREGRVAIQVYNPRLEPAAIAIRAVRPPA
jgi:hypothetical protein